MINGIFRVVNGSKRSPSRNERGGALLNLILILAIVALGALIGANILIEGKKPATNSLSTPKALLGEIVKLNEAEADKISRAKAAAAEKKTAAEAMAKASERKSAEEARAAKEKEAAAVKEAKAEEHEKATTIMAGEGDYVVRAGLFRSQRYLNDLERTLDRMEIPHFREKVMRQGESFLLTSGDDGAAAILMDAGYEVEVSEGKVSSFFFLEKEAQAALKVLKGKDLQGETAKFKGDIPIWKLICGPYDKETATAVVERLTVKNIVDAKLSRR